MDTEGRILQLEGQLDMMKRHYVAKQQLIWNLLVRVSNCESMAGIAPTGLGLPSETVCDETEDENVMSRPSSAD